MEIIQEKTLVQNQEIVLETQPEKIRYKYLDLLKILAIIMVVFYHAMGGGKLIK